MNEFMSAMSLNHECLRIKKKAGESSQPNAKVYQGTSPDEITLVSFAKQCGFEFRSSSDHYAKLKIPRRRADELLDDMPHDSEKMNTMPDHSQNDVTGTASSQLELLRIQSESSFNSAMEFDQSLPNVRHPQRPDAPLYQILSRMDFTSDRRRMSVLVRDPSDNLIKLYVKGADDVIRDRLKQEAQNPMIDSKVDSFVREASKTGLRTLLFAMKIIDEEELQDFQEQLTAIQEMKTRSKQREEEHYSKLESNLTLLGATAVEDKLQDDVPEVISALQDAQIKVWMLTGDKFETAENIARSCSLIKPNFEVFRLKTKQDVAKYCSDEFIILNDGMIADKKQRAMVVENTALSYITEYEKFQLNFVRVSKTCEAVICCRLRPGQKADVVRMIKTDDRNVLTLAIGDGANDVSMIKEAHVGVGIFGNEGLRAVQASDFAIPEFRFLHRLILYHGRTRYLSISQFILYFFYKNFVLTLPQYYFAYVSAYSAMSIFDDFYIQLYNTAFTSATPVVLACIYWDLMTDMDGPEYEALLGKLYYVG